MRMSLALLLLLAAASTQGATRTWPGAAPCNGTLQGCLAGSAANDVVLVASDGPIDEALTIDKSLVLRAAVGYAPRIAAGRDILATSFAAAAFNVTIEGLRLSGGKVLYIHSQPFASSVRIARMTVDAAPTDAGGIEVRGIANAPLTAEVYDNRITITGSRPGIDVNGPFNGTSAFEARVMFNHVQPQSQGIVLTPPPGGTVDAFGNRITGRGFRHGLFATVQAEGAAPTFNLLNNFVRGQRDSGFLPGALVVHGGAGDSVARALNNTLLDNDSGLVLDLAAGMGGTLSGAAENNLVAYHRVVGIDIDTASTVTNQANLVHGNAIDRFTPGPGTQTAEPELLHPERPFPTLYSPLVGNGNSGLLFSVLAARSLPRLDAAGLHRDKDVSGLDIGAFEFGDFSFPQSADAPSGNTAALTPPFAAFMSSNTFPQLTARVPLSGAVANVHYTGLYLFDSPQRWAVFNEDFAAMPAGADFTLFRPWPNQGVFGHFAGATGGNNFTAVPHATLDGQPAKFVLATHHWNGHGSGGVYLAHPFAVAYVFGTWIVFNTDLAAMPANVAFNLYVQDPSPQAFVHTVSAANRLADRTFIDHPLANGSECALLSVTPNATSGAYSGHPIAVTYSASVQKHAIVNLDGAAMPLDVQFNVLVDEGQVARACAPALFADSFEQRGG